LKEKKADLIGLARMLWVDPQMQSKVRFMYKTGYAGKTGILPEMEK